VLQGVKPKVGKICGLGMTVDAKNAAFFVELVPV
jgi:hypothetical protein